MKCMKINQLTDLAVQMYNRSSYYEKASHV